MKLGAQFVEKSALNIEILKPRIAIKSLLKILAFQKLRYVRQ